jgi:hypothetical protein
MQQVFGGGDTVTGANRLNCTANDIRLSRATQVSPTSCIEGTHFDLTATFEVNVTANARYDAGFFFRIDGGDDARNPTGTCSLTQLDRNISPALNLDGDTCGDLNAGTVNVTFTIPNVLCQDTDGDGKLNLPNCTSWHSNQGTACTLGNANGAKPDTKSKCVCDDTFQVPVTVETPNGAVFKTATEALVTYEVTVKNNSSNINVTLQSLTDNVYGDITKDKNTGNTAVDSTDCATGGTIAKSGGTYTCHFKAKHVNDDGTTDPGQVSNTVTATLRDPAHPTNDIDLTGSTTVDIDLGADNRP